MSVYLAWHFLYLFLRPRSAERIGRHRTGTAALSVIERLCSERGEDMPGKQPSQHRYSRLWD